VSKRDFSPFVNIPCCSPDEHQGPRAEFCVNLIRGKYNHITSKGFENEEGRDEKRMTVRERLVQSAGILVVLFGLFLGTVGVNKAVGGTTTIIINLNPLFIVEVDQVLGLVFSIVGIVALIGGIALCYVGFKLQRLNVVCIILGSCGLIIPNMILGLGYNLAAGIAAIIIGYPWLATLFLWLTGGENE
jgi:hypothetical protein